MENKGSILIVDDDESTCRTLSLIFDKKGYETETAGAGREAIEKAEGGFFNLALLDIKLPDMDGIKLLVSLKEIHPDMEMIMVTGYASPETAVRAMSEGASAYIIKPLKMDEVLAAAREALGKQRLIREKRRSEEALKQTLRGMIKALVSAVEIRDFYTAGHLCKVAKLAFAISKEIGLPDEKIEAICIAGLIHDIGKIFIPAEILNKPSLLSEIEMDLVKKHPRFGYDILKEIDFPWPIARIVHQHHERIDGSGYPQGLSGRDILLEARILAVADVVEAMASHRSYRPDCGIEKALEEISQNRGILYDADVVGACLKVINEKGFQF